MTDCSRVASSAPGRSGARSRVWFAACILFGAALLTVTAAQAQDERLSTETDGDRAIQQNPDAVAPERKSQLLIRLKVDRACTVYTSKDEVVGLSVCSSPTPHWFHLVKRASGETSALTEVDEVEVVVVEY